MKESHVACMGGMRNAYKALDGKPERERSLEHKRIILKLILKNGMGRCGLVWLRLSTSGGLLESR
jgi:hypothetical protein